jgi:hypothetical protein
MRTPPTAQLRTAVEGFSKLGQRLNTHAEHSVINCRNRRTVIIKPAARKSRRLNIHPHQGPSPLHGGTANTRCWSNAGSVCFIIFKTGHALPLAGARLLRPRLSRGAHAEHPHEMSGSWPRARQIRELDSAEDRPRTQTVIVRKQSVSALSPRKQARPRTGSVRGNAVAASVGELAAATPTNCPQSVRSLEQSAPANRPRMQSVREHGTEKNYLRRCIAVSFLPPISFSLRLKSLSRP